MSLPFLKQSITPRCLAIVFCWFLYSAGHAQSTVAKIRYEQAEEAFAKADYTTTLIRLNDAEKLLGSTNPKILYLRIMTQKSIIATNKFDFNILTEARKNAETFIKSYEKNEGIEEKFKEVFLFSEELEKLPKTEEELSWQKDAPKREAAEKKAAATAFMDNLANQYKFKKGLTEEAFRAYNSFSAELVKKKNLSKDLTQYTRKHGFTDTDDNYLYNEGPKELVINNGVVFSFAYVLKNTSADKNNLEEAASLFNSYKTQIYNLFSSDLIYESTIGGIQSVTVSSVGSSGLVNSITIRLMDPGTFKPKYRVNIVEIEFN